MITKGFALLPPEVEETAAVCVDSGLTIHRVLGPGFKEPIYHRAFCLELDARGVRFESEKPITVRYKHWEIPGQKVDLLVAGCVLVEIKAVPALLPLHEAQVLSYLKTTGVRLGLLLNFGGRLFKDGIQRVAL